MLTRRKHPNGETLELMPFQLEAFERARLRLAEHRAVYLALDPGLGKTILALMLMKEVSKGTNLLYIVPAGLKSNVEAEIKKWRVKGVSLVSDSMLHSYWPPEWIDVMVIDEAQRFSNPKSQRSGDLYWIAGHARKVILLSGTPSPNSRPIELWPVLENFAPEIFGNYFFGYALRYCAAYESSFGWDFSGFSNKDEFKRKIYESFMIRMKKDRLTLPEKREGILTVGENIPPIVSKLEMKTFPKDLLEGKISQEREEQITNLSQYLRCLGQFKLKYILPHIDRILEDTREKLLIFAMHTEVISGLASHLRAYDPIVITGQTPVKSRKPLVDTFQTDPNRRVAILNIIAGGIGWTMTEADRVIMVEFSWRDGDNSQASDRAHRIGSKKPVLVQYVVLKDSYDGKRLAIVLNKRRHAV